MDTEIQFSRHEAKGGTYAQILLNRPEKGNALTMAMLEQLERFVKELALDRLVRVVVLRGGGRFFCTGGDITHWGALTPREMAEGWILRGLAILESIAALPQPVIAAIHGHALGGGLELALVADLRLGLRTAKFGTPEVAIGMVAGWGGVKGLVELVGLARARHLTLLGNAITAEEALRSGLITELAETPETFELALKAWIERLLANAPLAMALTKGLLAGTHVDTGQLHSAAVEKAAASADCAEGVRAFSTMRAPIFEGR